MKSYVEVVIFHLVKVVSNPPFLKGITTYNQLQQPITYLMRIFSAGWTSFKGVKPGKKTDPHMICSHVMAGKDGF